MKWEKLKNGDWIARGDKGDFLVWKDGRTWRARYRHIYCQIPKFFLWDLTLKDIKERCERNAYWEA